jgi:hypothetical protein
MAPSSKKKLTYKSWRLSQFFYLSIAFFAYKITFKVVLSKKINLNERVLILFLFFLASLAYGSSKSEYIPLYYFLVSVSSARFQYSILIFYCLNPKY